MTTRDPLRRRAYLHLTGLTAAIAAAGCLGDDDSSTDDSSDDDSSDADSTDDSSASTTGLLSTEVTDQPGDIADFESCVVTIEGTWIKPSGETGGVDDDAGAGNETDGNESEHSGNESDTGLTEQDEDDVDRGEGRRYLEFDDPQEADLVQLQDGNTQLIDEREVEAGEYQFLQLDVAGVEGVLEEGDEADVETPGNAPLQFNRAFEIRDGERTTFVGDFTPVRRGQGNRYLLQPVARRTEVIYEGAADDGTDDVTGTETNGNESDESAGNETTADSANQSVSDDDDEGDGA